MKRTPILTIWSISLTLVILFANTLNAIFWLSFVAFCITSIYIEKHSKRLEKEED